MVAHQHGAGNDRNIAAAPGQEAPHEACRRAPGRNVVDAGIMVAARTGEIGNQRDGGDAIFGQPVRGFGNILRIGGDEGDARRLFPPRDFQRLRQCRGIERRHLYNADRRALQMGAGGCGTNFGSQRRHEGIVVAGKDEDQ
ncbi:hypothetical protein D3C87_1516790 [compost metagenome]